MDPSVPLSGHREYKVSDKHRIPPSAQVSGNVSEPLLAHHSDARPAFVDLFDGQDSSGDVVEVPRSNHIDIQDKEPVRPLVKGSTEHAELHRHALCLLENGLLWQCIKEWISIVE